MKKQSKKLIHLAGSLLAVSGIIFVLLNLYKNGQNIDLNQLSWYCIVCLLVLSLVYAFANSLLAAAWMQILLHLKMTIDFFSAYHIYGISQIAKYLPGNIFHIAGRQGLGMAAGISGWALVKSTVLELAMISSTACLFSALVLPLFFNQLALFFSYAVFVVAVIVVFFTICSLKFAGKHLGMAFLFYTIFLSISGSIFTVILLLLSENFLSFFIMPAIAGSFIIAWLIGLVTPGAPAGIGIREMVLLFLLKGKVTDADLLLAVILGRLVTVSGDLFFLFFSALSKRFITKTNQETVA